MSSKLITITAKFGGSVIMLEDKCPPNSLCKCPSTAATAKIGKMPSKHYCHRQNVLLPLPPKIINRLADNLMGN